MFSLNQTLVITKNTRFAGFATAVEVKVIKVTAKAIQVQDTRDSDGSMSIWLPKSALSQLPIEGGKNYQLKHWFDLNDWQFKFFTRKGFVVSMAK